MSIASAISNTQQKVANAYTAISGKGGTLPATQNLSNMPTAINSITELKGSTTSITATTSSQTVTPTSPSNGFTSVTVPAVTSAIDANIVAGNIKKDVTILGVLGIYEGGGGGGGGSGYNLIVQAYSNYGNRYRVWINGEVAIDSNQYTFNSHHTIYFKNVENLKWEIVDGFWEPGSWDDANIVMGGVTTQLTPDQTYNLTADCVLTVNNNSCLTGDTLVTMWDKTTKRIDEVEIGDIVLAVDPKTNKLVPDAVIFTDKDEIKYNDNYEIWTFSEGYTVKTVKRHRFYNVEEQRFKYMDEWKLGEHTYTIDGKVIELLSHEVVEEQVRHYKITILKNHNYFANGILTGSRLTPEIHVAKIDEPVPEEEEYDGNDTGLSA